MAKNDIAVRVRGLKKSYGKTQVLNGIDLSVRRGTMLALLGPNGAGKTTTVRILSTLLQHDAGEVRIGGFDVATQSEEVKSVIGLTGQSAAVDELLTGRENLHMMGMLYRLTKKSARLRAEELLADFDLLDAANRPVKTYSGGMRRRLDLAVSLIAVPPIIFLDEPTTGLDPRSRIAMWNIIKGLLESGTTILLTTQYLEEADQLADQIAVIDGGKVIAEGTAKQLKSKVGKDRLELVFKNETDARSAAELLKVDAKDQITKDHALSMIINDTNKDVREILDNLARHKLEIVTLAVHKPTLDDVFMSLTGSQAEAKNGEEK